MGSRLGERIDANHLLVVPVRSEADLLGFLVADRRWETQPIGDVDKLVLNAFPPQAAQIIRYHGLQRKFLLDSRYLTTLGFVAAGLGHELRTPVGVLKRDLRNSVGRWRTRTMTRRSSAPNAWPTRSVASTRRSTPLNLP